MKKYTSSVAVIAMAATVLTNPVLKAGESPDMVPAQDTPPMTDSSWQFTLSPYLWAAGLSGSVGIGRAVSEVDLSSRDILDNLDIGAMLHFEARKGRWAFLFDGFWMKLDADADTPGPLFGGANIKVEELRLAGLIAYRVMEGPTTLDLLAGASYFSIKTDFELLSGILNARSFNRSEDWVDPVVGFHVRHELSERWFSILRGEVGGFNVGSDFTWQAMAGAGYRIGENSEAFLGYRHLDIDYSDNNFTYDTETSGFILGVNFLF